ncbi:hypothetical protein X802_00960 [Thermococcus guaymasensis DSM 11113]|uniref:Uncharacterized protein n=1 Tax=Thermococcus guaymasensis DSM 11113 TaxID=1432656 RepID=A0A0X1KI47_9EURY|nr:hypothetical protein [Thermococcus guaymasensis]AJC70920.1 hypothetical protein X802_00960 [Thermococcus guaymasensis DSM 11113]
MGEGAYQTVPADLDELFSEPKEKPAKKATSGDSRPGKLPKAKLNKKLIAAIVRRLRILYLDAPKKEDRILINEILDDLEQLMILNGIGLELLGEKKEGE